MACVFRHHGEKTTTLIDTVDTGKTDVLRALLETAGVDRIDWVVSHHIEQDHCGTIPAVLERFPEATILATEKHVKRWGASTE